MNRQQDTAAARIDRANAKAQTSARVLQVRELAKATINCAVMEMPEDDRAEYMRESIRHLHTLYRAGEGQHAAQTLFGSLSKTDEKDLGRAISRARVDQMARTVFPTPANDLEGGE